MSGFYRRRGKRALDVVGAGAALVVLSPVLAATALAVRVGLGAPVVFAQQRTGLHGRQFRLLKFRSMRHAVDEAGLPLPDEARLTPLGRRLRGLSLDELPELVNVLKGDMSLVGPRPLLVQYLDRYSAVQARRHEVRPGITGWTQVNGRNALGWEEKFALDVWYVDHLSLAVDLRIMWRTLATVVRGQGVASAGHATMPEFMGPSQAS
ncbi:MAG: sugar transferase [Candidatus Nanopelagicales bacterium]